MRHIIKYGFLVLLLIPTLFVQAQNISNKIEHALSAVVTVSVEKAMPSGKMLMGFRGKVMEEAYQRSLELTDAVSSGSGFIIEKNGKMYIITNAHVVESASDETGSLYIYSYNRKKYEVKVLGGDSFYDLAVLEFVDKPGKELLTLAFAPQLPAIASKVYAIGNPLGVYPYTVTDGIVSAVNRVRGGVTGKYGFIQTTATLIWGNSGGPLINEEGQVVGINSQIAFADAPDGTSFQMQQINFALESPLAMRLVDDIILKGKPVRAYLGIELKQRWRMGKTKEGWGLTSQIDELPIISRLTPGTDAAIKLSTYIGWTIAGVNGVEVRNLEETLGEFEKIKPGEVVKLRMFNKGAYLDANIKSTELATEHLEKLASMVLQQIPSFTVDLNSPQVKVYMDDKVRMGSSRTTYFMTSGGSSSKDLWRITTLADLGTLLRIYGMRGGVEYVFVAENDYHNTPKTYTQYFGEKDDIYQTMLWY
ncbi:MAG: S1C family serine protease [Bacteroidia bacterium]|nr:serine protease [Bacteroidia bacterium]MCO5253902.1 S1C family serine protease [Bacteroidota bacterium]MCZ2129114.1 S1C family serine protease [Bacteroidia bacterium]